MTCGDSQTAGPSTHTPCKGTPWHQSRLTDQEPQPLPGAPQLESGWRGLALASQGSWLSGKLRGVHTPKVHTPCPGGAGEWGRAGFAGYPGPFDGQWGDGGEAREDPPAATQTEGTVGRSRQDLWMDRKEGEAGARERRAARGLDF